MSTAIGLKTRIFNPRMRYINADLRARMKYKKPIKPLIDSNQVYSQNVSLSYTSNGILKQKFNHPRSTIWLTKRQILRLVYTPSRFTEDAIAMQGTQKMHFYRNLIMAKNASIHMLNQPIKLTEPKPG